MNGTLEGNRREEEATGAFVVDGQGDMNRRRKSRGGGDGAQPDKRGGGRRRLQGQIDGSRGRGGEQRGRLERRSRSGVRERAEWRCRAGLRRWDGGVRYRGTLRASPLFPSQHVTLCFRTFFTRLILDATDILGSQKEKQGLV